MGSDYPNKKADYKRIIDKRQPKTVSNTEMSEATGYKPTILQTNTRNWRQIGRDLRMWDESTEQQSLDWNPQAERARDRPKQTWERTVLVEAGKSGKAWSEVRRFAGKCVRWRCFTNVLGGS